MNCDKKDISIELTTNFKRDFKKLAKRYHSLGADFLKFMDSIYKNPLQGTDLGNGIRKIRMSISSKGKGKSGGARVITYGMYLEKENKIYLLSIYDKSEKASISDKELRDLIGSL